MTTWGDSTTSPPTRCAPTSAASSRIPAAQLTAHAAGRSPGAPKPTTRLVATPPIAAMSASDAAADFRPMSIGVDQSRRKWRPSMSTSQVTATRPSGAATTAVSSPGPTITGPASDSPAVMRSMSSNSPTSCSVPPLSLLMDASLAGMSVQAYVLIQTEVGKAATVVQAIRDISGVTLAEDVTGPYDVIVRAEARTMDELGKLVVARIQAVPGITRTLTCPVVNL